MPIQLQREGGMERRCPLLALPCCPGRAPSGHAQRPAARQPPAGKPTPAACVRSLNEQPDDLHHGGQEVEGCKVGGQLPQAAAKQRRARHRGRAAAAAAAGGCQRQLGRPAWLTCRAHYQRDQGAQQAAVAWSASSALNRRLCAADAAAEPTIVLWGARRPRSRVEGRTRQAHPDKRTPTSVPNNAFCQPVSLGHAPELQRGKIFGGRFGRQMRHRPLSAVGGGSRSKPAFGTEQVLQAGHGTAAGYERMPLPTYLSTGLFRRPPNGVATTGPNRRARGPRSRAAAGAQDPAAGPGLPRGLGKAPHPAEERTASGIHTGEPPSIAGTH